MQTKRFQFSYNEFTKECITNIVNKHKLTKERIYELELFGFDVKRCYIPNYNGLLGITEMKRKKEIRVIIGRPKNHSPKEVFAVILRKNEFSH